MRTTPALLALFKGCGDASQSVALLSIPLIYPIQHRDRKSLPTFADALALVRQQLWQFRLFQLSNAETDTVNVPRAFFKCWSDLRSLCCLMAKVELSARGVESMLPKTGGQQMQITEGEKNGFESTQMRYWFISQPH